MSLVVTRTCDHCHKTLNAVGHLAVDDTRQRLDFCGWKCLRAYTATVVPAKPGKHKPPYLRDAVQDPLPGVM